jgi:hypothetical protein
LVDCRPGDCSRERSPRALRGQIKLRQMVKLAVRAKFSGEVDKQPVCQRVGPSHQMRVCNKIADFAA